MNHMLLSIPIGLGIGYLAQRSRMCFVGGIRDYILVRDKVLLRGFISFFISAWLLYSLFFFLGVIDPRLSYYGSNGRPAAVHLESGASAPPQGAEASTPGRGLDRVFSLPPKMNMLALQFFLSGFGLGFLSILANGCPMRQHILAAQGNLDSMAYLLGFYGAVIFYDLVLSRYVFLIFNFG